MGQSEGSAAGSAEQQRQAARQRAQPFQASLSFPRHAAQTAAKGAQGAGQPPEAAGLPQTPQRLADPFGTFAHAVHSLLDTPEGRGDALHGIDDQVETALTRRHQSFSMRLPSSAVRSAHQTRSRAVMASSSDGGQ